MSYIATTERLEAENERLRQQVTELQENNTRLVEERRADDLFCQVWEFQSAMKIPCFTGPPLTPSDERVRLRLRLSAEEFFEQLESCFTEPLAEMDPTPSVETNHQVNALQRLASAVLTLIDTFKLHVNLPELVDSWCDMNYIHQGSAIEFGVDLKPIAREVHAANVAKLGGKVREDGKILKPENWTAPDVTGLLRQQGWRG
jgi:predicted HAD superfamily Cof-like phosphohydrolase